METPRGSWLTATAMLAVHVAVVAWSATRHSPTIDEPAQLAAGISHWTFGRFELNRDHPPLVRMLAALPVIAAGAKTDWRSFREGYRSQPVHRIGDDLIAANRERSTWLFTIARWACLPFTVLGGLLCFAWAKYLYRPAAGLFALLLWCSSPNIIAQAGLLTPILGAVSLGIAACYAYSRWITLGDWTGSFLVGALLGLALLTAFYWMILPIIWLGLFLFIPKCPPLGGPQRLRTSGQFGTLLVTAIYVVNLGYGFEGSLTRLRDFSFSSRILRGFDADSTGCVNRFADSWVGRLPVPLPANYVLGFDSAICHNYEAASAICRDDGSHHDWISMLQIARNRIPLGTSLLFAISVFFLVRCASAENETHTLKTLNLLLPALGLITIAGAQDAETTQLSALLAALPFLYIWSSRLVTVIAEGTFMPAAVVFCCLASSIAMTIFEILQ